MESGEAFQQLSIACATKAGLRSSNGSLDKTVKAALEEKGFQHFTLPNYVTWFEETFSTWTSQTPVTQMKADPAVTHTVPMRELSGRTKNQKRSSTPKRRSTPRHKMSSRGSGTGSGGVSASEFSPSLTPLTKSLPDNVGAPLHGESCCGEFTWQDLSRTLEIGARVLYPTMLVTYALIVVYPKL